MPITIRGETFERGLSIVVPVYRGAGTIGTLVAALSELQPEGGLEIILVNDGSPDHSGDVCRALARSATVPLTYIEHARNFGEHNAVITGLRHARGQWVVTMDDDGQNPPAEALRLLEAAQRGGHDAVFGDYEVKEHSAWRNLGSWFANRVAGWVLDKPSGLYLSSFRCLSRFLVEQIVRYAGPYPYIDGLILQCTRSVTSIEVQHKARAEGRSGYTVRKLVHLWLNLFTNFSVLPLRLATVLGLSLAALGVLGVGWVVFLHLTQRGPAFGWGSLMAALLVFSGTQLVMLGLIGEYLGRAYLSANGRPQAVVREVWRNGK